MNIEIRNVKYFAAGSEETACFRADIYVDGKKAGTAENQGCGGPTLVDPRDLEERVDAFAKTLPIKISSIEDGDDPSGFFSYTQTAESIVNDLLTEHLSERDLKRALSKRLLYTRNGVVYETKALKATEMQHHLQKPDLALRLKADQVLNLLPFVDAFAIYRAQA